MWWWIACGGPGGGPGGGDTDRVEAVPTDGGGDWTLVVRDAAGEPVADARVELFEAGGRATRSLGTDADGSLVVDELEPGTYGAEVYGALTAAWIFTVDEGADIDHVVVIPEPNPRLALPLAATDVGDGLVLTVDELDPPTFEAPTDTLGAVRIDLPWDGAGTAVASWLLDPFRHLEPDGMSVAFDLPGGSDVALEVWQPDVRETAWRRAGSVGPGSGRLQGDAVLVTTEPVVLVRPAVR